MCFMIVDEAGYVNYIISEEPITVDIPTCGTPGNPECTCE